MILTIMQINWEHTCVIVNSYLESIGLQATSYGVLCCIQCEVAYTLSGTKTHVRDHHKIKLDEAAFSAAVDSCDIHPNLPSLSPAFPIPPLPGLSVQQGFWCDHCPGVSETVAGIKKHGQRMHSGTSPRTFTPGSIQKFNDSSHKTSWRVQPSPPSYTPPPLSQDDFTLRAHSILTTNDADPDTIDNIHNINSWLRATQWHELLREYDSNYVRSLVALPTPDESALLRCMTAIDAWMAEAELSIGSVHVALRKQVNTEQPAK